MKRLRQRRRGRKLVAAGTLLARCSRLAAEVDGVVVADAELVAAPRAQVAEPRPDFDQTPSFWFPSTVDRQSTAAAWVRPTDAWCAADVVAVGGDPFRTNRSVWILRTVPVCASVGRARSTPPTHQWGNHE